MKGSVCIRHGATWSKRLCSHHGCTNYAKKGGVCSRHGAKKPTCSHEGCTNGAVKGGVCWRHGAKVPLKICSHDKCTKNAQKGGVCIRHGAKVKRCSHEGCTNHVQKGGVCRRHGTKDRAKAKKIRSPKGASTSQSSAKKRVKPKYRVGVAVSKKFYDEDIGIERPFSGNVIGYDADAKLYSIRYEDGDEEEMDEGELAEIVCGKEGGGGAGKKRKEKSSDRSNKYDRDEDRTVEEGRCVVS